MTTKYSMWRKTTSSTRLHPSRHCLDNSFKDKVLMASVYLGWILLKGRDGVKYLSTLAQKFNEVYDIIKAVV